MSLDNIILELTIIVAGAALLATVFLFARQPIILAYIAVGVLAGPYGLGWLEDAGHIESISHFGVILLLFLLGLHLQPTRLLGVFRRTVLVTLGTALVFGLASGLVASILRFALEDALIVGAAMMFSSTVISLKLLPIDDLESRHAGEMMTSVLLLQDVLAIIVILLITAEHDGRWVLSFFVLLLKLALLGGTAFGAVQFALVPLFKRSRGIREFTFLITLGWCLISAEVAHAVGLSYEMGAFVGGLSIGSCQIAQSMAEELKPLREFFLILFFFSIGAKFDLGVGPRVWLTGASLAALLLILKPLAFYWGFRSVRESKDTSKELAIRLGQASEFSLLVSFSALAMGELSSEAAYVVQLAAVLTFAVSTYWVVFRYPTPISDRTRADAG